nr:integrase, catalytic region, zinc finger, CCHC-type, peptidase aspartic, catalytic [Tanacetum cinerariifolium]
MLTKPQFFYDHTTRQALGFQNPCYLKKAQQLEPKLDDGSIIQKTNAIVIHDSEETLMLKDESHSKMLQKLKDPMMSEKETEQVFWSQNSINSEEPNLSTRPTIVEVPKELPKVSMVNSSLKKLKFHLASFDVAVKQHRVKTNRFQDKMKDVLNVNERVLEQAISTNIVNIVVNANVNYSYEPVNECKRCVTLETELQKDFIKKECYDKLNNSFSQLSVPSFDQLFEINDLQAQSQVNDTIIMKLKERIKSLSGNLKEEKIKNELEEIETVNIKLDHRVTKLVIENEHLKQTYKQLYDSIKSSRVRSKEQCDDLIKQVNIKSAENFDLNASLQKKSLVIAARKDTLRKLKGKAVDDEAVNLHPIDLELLRIDVVQIVLWYLDSECSKHMTGDCSQLTNFVNKFLGTIKFDGVDLLTGSRGNNLYTLSLGDMMASSHVCLFFKALKTKSWLWHRCLSHLNFSAINHLAGQSLVRGLPKLKFEKDHLCSACAMGKRKLQPKADIGIFIGYVPIKKAFWIYNKRTRRIVETIHVKFDELAAMASEQSNSRPALHEMTPVTISLGLVPKPTSSTPFVPPSRNDWDFLFQPLFDELLTPPPSVDPPAPEGIALITDVIPPEQAESTGLPSSTIVDQDAPSLSKSQTTPETQPPIIPQDVEEDNHDIEVAHMGNDPLFGMPIPEVASDQSSSTVSSHTIVHPDH